MDGKQNEIRLYTGVSGVRVFVNDEEINAIGCVSAELHARGAQAPQLIMRYLSDAAVEDHFINEP